jgi:hypothetical protein
MAAVNQPNPACQLPAKKLVDATKTDNAAATNVNFFIYYFNLFSKN